jgi:hypothetical protein
MSPRVEVCSTTRCRGGAIDAAFVTGVAIIEP